MTMSNAVPRFGMRPVVALVVMAVVAALAALLAVGLDGVGAEHR